MEFFTEQSRIKSKVQDIIGLAKEKKESISPLVAYQTDKATEMIHLSKRKGAMSDEKKYNRLRETFEQNYNRLHPHIPEK